MCLALFQRRIDAAADTVIAVARFEGAEETVTFRPPQGYAAVCHGFVVTYRSGYRNKRIGISVDAPLKKCSAYGADIFTPHLPQAASSPQAPQGEDNWGTA